MPILTTMTDHKPTSAHDDAEEARRPYTAPTAAKLGRIEDLTSAGTGGIMEHGAGTGSTFSLA